MTRIFSGAMRRANRLMSPTKLRMAARSLQKAMTGMLVKSALAPLSALEPKPAKPRKKATPKSGRTLGVVLKQLRAVQVPEPTAAVGNKRHTGAVATREGARFLSRTHSATTGTRDYKIYLPASQPKRPKGLILMLHGCSQNPDDFARGTHMNSLAEKSGLAIVYPSQTGKQNAASCWNWFEPGNQSRGAGEPAVLASLTKKLMADYDLRRDCVFVAGLSAGGAMAAILADVYPDIFSAAGVHSGLARGSARNVLSAMSVMRNGGVGANAVTETPTHKVRRIVFQGDADSVVHPSNASMIVASALGDDAIPTKITKRAVRGRTYTRSDFAGSDGVVQLELWMLEGAQHAWSGGRPTGSFTDSKGPDASAQMIRFFLAKSG